MELFDSDHSRDEKRWILIGLSTKRRVLLVVFVEKYNNTMRIISARKAHKDEIAQYYMKVDQ